MLALALTYRSASAGVKVTDSVWLPASRTVPAGRLYAKVPRPGPTRQGVTAGPCFEEGAFTVHNEPDGPNGETSRDSYLRQIFTAIVAFREGNFSVRLPTDWADIEGRVAEEFNQTIAQTLTVLSPSARSPTSKRKRPPRWPPLGRGETT